MKYTKNTKKKNTRKSLQIIRVLEKDFTKEQQ